MKTSKKVNKIIQELEVYVGRTDIYPVTKKALNYRILGYKSAYKTKDCINLKSRKDIENMFINLIEDKKKIISEETCQRISAISDILDLKWDNKLKVWHGLGYIYSEV